MHKFNHITILITAAFMLLVPVKLRASEPAAPPAMWGARLVVAPMTFNTTGFISWMKLANPGAAPMTVKANAFWTLADGTEGSFTGQSIGSVDPGGVFTIGEATFLSLMGDPTQLADTALELIVNNPDVRFLAEKKASDGRVSIPVERFYLFTDPSQASGAPTPGAPVAKTGQTTSYAAGDDGALQAGVAWPDPRFTDNGDGTVTDHLTGLIWLKKANCPESARDWPTAMGDVAQLNTDGTMNGKVCGDTSNGSSHQTDWRLPNIRELQSLIDFQNVGPALPAGHPFTGLNPVDYWSSTTAPGSGPPGQEWKWLLSSNFGIVTFTEQTTELTYAWPVRSAN